MLEETEGIINNGQFGHMDNIGSKSQNEDKQKQKTARQKTKQDEQDGPPLPKSVGEPRYWQRVSGSGFL